MVSSALLLVDDGAGYERLGARAIRDVEALARLAADADGRIEPVSTLPLAGTGER